MGAVPLRLRRGDRAQHGRRAARRAERQAALRLRAGAQRALVDLRLPARRGGARRRARLGRARLRLRQGQGADGDAAGRPGRRRQGHRRVRAARAPARRLRHHAGARRAEHDVRPRVPRDPGRPLERRLARHDQGRPGGAADRRVPGLPQPAAVQARPRGRDPRPGDPRERRALHPCGGGRADRQGAAVLPALARAGPGDVDAARDRGLHGRARRAVRGGRDARGARRPRSSAGFTRCSTERSASGGPPTRRSARCEARSTAAATPVACCPPCNPRTCACRRAR